MRPKPKKSLGQNFLQDPNIRRKIIAACDFCPDDTVIEIGPGQAAMTELIAPIVKRLYAIELDTVLAGMLEEQFKDDPRVSIINQDFLKCDIAALLADSPRTKVKVFGNIPYYITSPIIQHLFEYRSHISNIYLTVQKEFGQRIVAEPGSEHYGSFSCFVQYYTQPRIEFLIKRTCFYPAPKVDSCFLSLSMRPEPAVSVKDENLLFTIIRRSFGQRRKTLKNCLKGLIPADNLDSFFEKYSVNPKARAETLSLQDFANLANLKN
ncbi:MAG: 16S rRNA (adenine(1518)-N(6)/adenine(1519)-N(6))-dimethyltransferase RsmA [Candidatus Omnitrophica bacterium]|jgi:16S rRNA (adenine1518-N6/adenine1519-N6)-dimethyltransferase|nr:16S rRNA (adenine(1518)-N(6)/adenine(1519)-N(6))-dimethyltransferase RsmA [Candidatus Omnitrophota bacterium]